MRPHVVDSDPATQCSKCTRPRVEGRKLCAECCAALMAKNRARVLARVAKGMCARCGTSAPRAGLRHCVKCSEYFRSSATIKSYKRKWRLKKLYGITPQEWSDIMAAQGGKCAICEKPMSAPRVDHDHSTGRVRGMLCGTCNQALGLLMEDPVLCEVAGRYLRRTRLSATA